VPHHGHRRSRPARSPRGLKGLLARHPLVSFFVLAYVLTWLAWSPWYLSEDGIGLLPYDGESISDYLNTVALILGPTPSAFIMTGVTGGERAFAACCVGSCCGGWGFGGTCLSS